MNVQWTMAGVREHVAIQRAASSVSAPKVRGYTATGRTV